MAASIPATVPESTIWPGRVEIGDIHIGCGGECADLRFLAADQRGHRSLGGVAGGFHEFAASGDEVESVLEGKAPGGGVGGEFAERKSGGGDRDEIRQALADQGERDQAVEIQGGLAARGFRQFLVGAVEHDFRNAEIRALGRPASAILRAVAELSTQSLPMPTFWAPCPENKRTIWLMSVEI